MAQQTAMQTLIAWGDEMLLKHPQKILSFAEVIDKAEELLQMEKEQIINAIMYALDEDGHTGDWKIKFANDYYNKLNKGYDFSNKTRERFFGDKTL